MKRTLSLLVILSLTLFSCKQQTALKYNNYVIELELALVPGTTAATSKIDSWIEADKWDSVAAISKRMQSEVQGSIDKIQKKDAPDLKGAAEFKQGALRYFAYIRDIYTGYIKLAEQPDAEARSTESAKFLSMINEKDKVISDFQEKQRAFASANKIKLESK